MFDDLQKVKLVNDFNTNNAVNIHCYCNTASGVHTLEFSSEKNGFLI